VTSDSYQRICEVGVPEVRCDKGGTEYAEGYPFFYGKGNEKLQLETGFLYIRE
jgi:hypothetical protein